MRLRTETVPFRRIRGYFRARGKSLSSAARERIGDVLARAERHIIAILAANRGPNVLTGSQAFQLLSDDPVLGAFAREAAGTFVLRQPRITIASMRAAHPTKKQKKAAAWAAVASAEGAPSEHEAEEAEPQGGQSPQESDGEESGAASGVAEDLEETDDPDEEELEETPRKSKK